VPAFETGGFGTSLGAFFIEEGASATQIIGNEGVVGDATPDFQMSFSNDLTWKRLSFGFLFDWKQGGDVINLTEFLYDAGQNSVDYVGPGEERQRRFNDTANPETAVYVQDGSYLKLREVTLAYNVPEGVAQRLFGSSARYVRLSVSARNLLRFTGYRGLDPEVSNFGNQAIIRNIDVAPFPPSKSFFFSVDLGSDHEDDHATSAHRLLAAPRRRRVQYDITNPNSPDPIGENPSCGQVSAAANGMLITIRQDAGLRARRLVSLGREVLRIDGSDPRFISELLLSELVAGGDAFGGDHWIDQFGAVRAGNLILAAIPTAAQLSAEEISGTSGYVKTIQAYSFLMVLTTHTQDSIPIDIPLNVTSPPAPFVSNAAAYDRVVTLLDEGHAELLAGGGAFPFSLPPGFTGFNAPATFAQFNRALRAWVAAYRQDWQGCWTHWRGHSSTRRAISSAGVHGLRDRAATSRIRSQDPQNGENFAHQSLDTLAQLQTDGLTQTVASSARP
jgi:hypothetical protein